MKHGAAAILLMGFGTLICLIIVFGFSASRRANRIESKIAAIHDTYRRSASVLSRTKEATYLSSILVRDYLLDPAPSVAPQYQKELVAIRSSLTQHLDSMNQLISPNEAQVLERLRRELHVYWDTLDPVFQWTPQQKSASAYSFLRKEVIPRRNAVLSIMHEIDALTARNFQDERDIINRNRLEFQGYLREMLVLSVLLALSVAGVSIFRVSRLERKSEDERKRAEKAEEELRRLSQKLVQAQEEERKSISRELHDEIGQMLTGLKMELGNLDEFRDTPGDEFRMHLAETRSITEKTMRAVRDLAMGLRPSMLDDLGLEPALRWQAREFSRRSGVPVHITTDGNIDGLSEPLRTCIYRVVQESLTNCARHAKASNVKILVSGRSGSICLIVEDDGTGFDPESPRGRGMGLIGMEERVKELGGTLTIASQNRKKAAGTVLKIDLPVADAEVVS